MHKTNFYLSVFIGLFILTCLNIMGQDVRSAASEVRHNSRSGIAPKIREIPKEDAEQKTPVITSDAPSSNSSWRRVVYLNLDLDDEKNAVLYYPEDPIGSNGNLFHIIFANMANGNLKGYEYLDGREVFLPEFEVNFEDILEKFEVPYKIVNSSDKSIKEFEIDPIDIPSREVLSYFVIEDWEFDNIENRTSAKIAAICPILHRMGDFEEEILKYPMSWILMDDLRPLLGNTYVFIDETDITPKYTLNDFFTLNLYNGEIYKTRNLRNKTFHELYPDETTRKNVSDSIQKELRHFDKSIWVPSRDEVIAAREAKQKKEEIGDIPIKEPIKASKRRTTRSSRGSDNGTKNNVVTRSVRDRK